MRKKDLLGYGVASVADSGPYNFVLAYFILFLTTVAGVDPEVAGTISSITILFDGILSVVIGYISDNWHSPKGRRRPFMRLGAIPLAAGVILMFIVYPGSALLKAALYVLAGTIFWFGFGTYYTPYTALGAELTDDYNERSVLRTYARYFGIAGNFIGVVFPLLVVEFLMARGASEAGSWIVMAAIVGVASAASIFITCRVTRGKERVIAPEASGQEHQQEQPKPGVKALFRDYYQVLKIKPFKYLIAVIATFIVANTFYNSSMVFYARYELGIHDSITSTVFLISMIANVVYTPLTGAASVRFSKKKAMAFCMFFAGGGGMLLFLVGIHSYFAMIVYVLIFSVAYSCFWQLVNSIVYDLSEVAEFKFGRHIEGSISSVYGFVFTIFTSMATAIFGWVLKFGHYNAAFLLIPAVCLILAGLFQALYPLNEARFNKLKQALEDKRAGREPDLTGLEHII